MFIAFCFRRYLTVIPSESHDVYEKGAKHPTTIMRPLQPSVDIIEAVMKVGLLISK